MSTSLGTGRTLPSSLFIAVVLLATPDISAAWSKFANCDGCLENQSEAAATELTKDGRVYIMDRMNDTITAYDVVTSPEFDPPSTVATDTSTPAHIGDYFSNLVTQLHTAVDSSVPISSTVAGSAHELVGNHQVQVKVGEYVRDQFFVNPEIEGVHDSELGRIRASMLEDREIKTGFADGSEARFRFEDLAVGADFFQLVDNSLTGPQGNTIPDGPGDITAGMNGSFSPGGPGGLRARDSFAETLQSLGISLSGNGLSGDGDACATFVCGPGPASMACEFTFTHCQ